MSQLTVSYERKFSDGNYGSEGLALSVTYDVDLAELTTELAIDRADWLRNTVLAILGASGSYRVASAARDEVEEHMPREERTGRPVAVQAEVTLEDLPF